MVFSPPPDYLYSVVHPITGVVTYFSKMIEADLSFGRASASYAVWSGDGGINPHSGGAAPVKIRTFKFTFIHPYDPGETFTQQRDRLVAACNHGMEMDFFVLVGDGTFRQGRGVANAGDFSNLTRDQMVMFKATIEIECVNPFLRDRFESGTLRWDNALTWDVGVAVYQISASAPITGGTYRIVHAGNTSAALSGGARAVEVQFALDTATPSAIPYLAYSPANEKSTFSTNPPSPVILSARSPGVSAVPTITPTGITGGTISVVTLLAGSAAATNIWDFTPNRVTLNANPRNFTIVAGGNVSDRELMIFVDGPISPYYVYNLSQPGGLFGYLGFAMTEGLLADEQHQIDVGRQRVRKVVGNNSYSAWPKFYLPPGQEDWFRVDPGTNVISIQQTLPASTTGQFRLSTTAHYL